MNSRTPKQTRLFSPAKKSRVVLFLFLIIATAFWGSRLILDIILTNGVTFIEPVIFVLFMACFIWISIGFWSSVIGFILLLLKRDPVTLQPFKQLDLKQAINQRTAIVMPIYNESPSRVMAGLQSTLESLAETSEQGHFDCFVLSDTTDSAIAEEEYRAWALLKKQIAKLDINLFYRRRSRNHYRKVGNLKDFCERWGSQYDYMIVLDADSIMDGDGILKLVRRMQANTDVGLIQTIPLPVRQRSFFGRFLQFAADLHSPLLATGYSFWQTDTGNYWGHNAIIRVSAFMDSCHLPHLPGLPPFGGEILSHDFVEAALLKRAGWKVITQTDPTGSYEEIPSNILDYIVRDRRWCQGNLQHLRLLGGKGLHPISYFHFISGAFAYISSPLWLLMLTMGTTDAIIQTLSSNEFFSQPYQLFPDWRIAKPELIYTLLSSTLGLLFFPKLLAVVVASIQRANHFGGLIRLWASAIIEMLYSIIIAPLMMMFHTWFVFSLVAGVAVGWKPQARDGRGIRWREAFKYTALLTMTTLIWGAIAFTYAPDYFLWLIPVLTGLLVAGPLIRYSGSFWLGNLAHRLGLLSIESDIKSIPVIDRISSYQKLYQEVNLPANVSDKKSDTPSENWRKMPIQSFS